MVYTVTFASLQTRLSITNHFLHDLAYFLPCSATINAKKSQRSLNLRSGQNNQKLELRFEFHRKERRAGTVHQKEPHQKREARSKVGSTGEGIPTRKWNPTYWYKWLRPSLFHCFANKLHAEKYVTAVGAGVQYLLENCSKCSKDEAVNRCGNSCRSCSISNC